jgi:hypothetical protein
MKIIWIKFYNIFLYYKMPRRRTCKKGGMPMMKKGGMMKMRGGMMKIKGGKTFRKKGGGWNPFSWFSSKPTNQQSTSVVPGQTSGPTSGPTTYSAN